jgi:quercetin dioxygenase-like cupin family protein
MQKKNPKNASLRGSISWRLCSTSLGFGLGIGLSLGIFSLLNSTVERAPQLSTFTLQPTDANATPSAASKGKVVHLGQYEVRQVGKGKAQIEILAQGREAFLGRLTVAGGGAVPEHRDPTEEYLLIISGSGILNLDGETHTLKAGSVVYMPAQAKVSFKNGPDPLVAIQVFAGPQSAKKYDAWERVAPR